MWAVIKRVIGNYPNPLLASHCAALLSYSDKSEGALQHSSVLW